MMPIPSPDSSKTPPDRPAFPPLPIVTPDPPRRSASERFGSLFYLAISGLLVVLLLVGWFVWQAWQMREVWRNVYVLHDAARAEPERVEAARALSGDPRVNQRQRWDIVMRRDLPPRARYVVAEGLTAEAAAADPRAYGTAVARSEGWPDWLRLLLVRPMAYSAAMDRPVSREALERLRLHGDPAIRLWALFSLAVGPEGDPGYRTALQDAAAADTPTRALAELLVRAIETPRESDRLKVLDEATAWLRAHYPPVEALWSESTGQ